MSLLEVVKSIQKTEGGILMSVGKFEFIINKVNYEVLEKYLKETNFSDFIRKSNVEQEINYLKGAFKNEELVLVLGAGVSVPYNLPSWENLLQKLLFETFNNKSTNKEVSTVLAKLFPELFPNSPIISARFLEEFFKKNKNAKPLDEMVREALYEKIDRVEDSKVVKEILQFCIAPGKSPNLNSIITYNYDDILEFVLNKSEVDIPFKSIYKVGMNYKNGELPIYHVHGYLPQYQEGDKGFSVTLSENLYHKQYNDIYGWSNMVQINKFKDNVCIFIGISLTDPNLRRLLDIANLQKGDNEKYHYLFKKKYSEEDVQNDLEEILQKNGSLLNEKSKANLKIEETAEQLIKKMEEFEELDAESFGIKIIWIEEFDEIAEILEKIRRN